MAETSFDTFEIIYSDALVTFGTIFDADLYGGGYGGQTDEDRTTERETREAWRALLDDCMDAYPDTDAADIREAIREAASDLHIPTEWTDT